MEKYFVKRVENPKSLRYVKVPGSKSITNRALLIAALADGCSVLEGVLFSDDSRHFLKALQDLGFFVEIFEKECKVKIEGCSGKIPCVVNQTKVNAGKLNKPVSGQVYVGSAGTAARFLTAFLGLSEGLFYVDASEQMKKRPMKELLVALESLGAVIEYEEEEYHFPFFIGNAGIARNEVVVDVDKSSQFLSALLISSVLFQEDFSINVTGDHGMAYVDMTIAMMEQFGAKVEKLEGRRYICPKENSYACREYGIEPDISAACYFYAMSALLRVPVQVLGVRSNSLQGDIQFLSVLDEMGCEPIEGEHGICMLPPPKGEGLTGGSFDLSSFSDQALTLAAIAPFASSMVSILNISYSRHQECDRIHAIQSNLQTLGITSYEEDGKIYILPGKPKAGEIQTFEDHRVAMAFTLIGLVTDGIVIQNPMCCRKTFENYYDVLESMLYGV